jgi:hypothetical protein
MRRKFKLTRRSVFLGILLSLAGVAWPADVPVATVNNVKNGAEVMELLVANNLAQGAKESSELRAAPEL